MPFVNQAQVRACFAKHDARWDCKKWAAHTPGGVKRLPKRAKKRKR